MRSLGILSWALLLVFAVGCTKSANQPDPPMGSTGDCMADLLFDGRTYDSNTIRSENFSQPVGRPIGSGEWVDCNAGQEPLGDGTRVYELKGVDPALAVAVPAGRGKAPKRNFTVMTPPAQN